MSNSGSELSRCGGVVQAIYNFGRDTLSGINNSTLPLKEESNLETLSFGSPGERLEKYLLTMSIL